MCKNFPLLITVIMAKKNFRNYDVINDDVITVFALICAVREKLDILPITPAQTSGRFCDYLPTYEVINMTSKLFHYLLKYF